LIFMEYCPEGTLEQLVTSSESGLSECLVRRFTRQLLQVSKEQLVTSSESGLSECLVSTGPEGAAGYKLEVLSQVGHANYKE
jgi:hypothetical protein